MLMKHKPSQYLAMPNALLKSLFCVCALCLKDDSGALAVGAPALFLNRPNCDDARSFLHLALAKTEGRSDGVAPSNSAWRKSLWIEDEGIECRRREAGWSREERAIGRGAETEGQVRVIFGRKRRSLEVFEISSVFAFPCSWDWWVDWQDIPSNMPAYCSPVLQAWPYFQMGLPCQVWVEARTHSLRFTTLCSLFNATVYWPSCFPALLFLSHIWLRLIKTAWRVFTCQ